jgi:hypothetical protein
MCIDDITDAIVFKLNASLDDSMQYPLDKDGWVGYVQISPGNFRQEVAYRMWFNVDVHVLVIVWLMGSLQTNQERYLFEEWGLRIIADAHCHTHASGIPGSGMVIKDDAANAGMNHIAGELLGSANVGATMGSRVIIPDPIDNLMVLPGIIHVTQIEGVSPRDIGKSPARGELAFVAANLIVSNLDGLVHVRQPCKYLAW